MHLYVTMFVLYNRHMIQLEEVILSMFTCSDCGSKLKGNGFEFRPGRMFVIEVVHKQWHLLQTVQRPEVCSAVCVLWTIKNPWSHSKRVGHLSPAILPWLCRKWHKLIFTDSLTHSLRITSLTLIQLQCTCREKQKCQYTLTCWRVTEKYWNRLHLDIALYQCLLQHIMISLCLLSQKLEATLPHKQAE